jgi:hypothetical protein
MTEADATTPGPKGPGLHATAGPGLYANRPGPPDGRRIAIATVGALIVAALILVAAVLPAEFGRDPLGTGKALGLLDLYAGAAEPAPPPAALPSDTPPMTMFKVDSVVFTLRPSEGFEYKYRIEKGGGLVYAWTATRPVNYEFHGEHDGAGLGVAVSYEKSTATKGSGSFMAPASGIHGWFWENTTDEPITLTLTSSGFYRWADEFRQRFDPVKHKGVVDRVRHELSEPASSSRRE